MADNDSINERKRPADAVDPTDDASPEKKQKVVLADIAKEYVCPITQELPIKPVTAEDGKVYEEKAIRESKDDVQARAWHERSAAARDPMGMARFGEFLLAGRGGEMERPLGLVIVTEAATLGSDLAAWRLGESFLIGDDGLPKDPARARYWLKKAADSECRHEHLNESGKATVARLLRELDDATE
jgi:hypothetical protein